MFERQFQRAMTYGSRLLFAIAVILVVSGFIEGMKQVMQMAGPGGRDRTTWLFHLKSLWTGLSDGWPYLLGATMRGLSSATLPLFGAIVVHRVDRWMRRRGLNGGQDNV